MYAIISLKGGMMKNKFLLSISGIIILTFLIILPLISLILASILAKDASILFALFIPLTFCIILFLYRKTAFSHIEIDSVGIRRLYRKTIINSLTWDEVMVVKSTHNLMLNFLEKEKDAREMANDYKTNIGFKITNKREKILLYYKPFFKNKITDISSLSKYYQNLLLQ